MAVPSTHLKSVAGVSDCRLVFAKWLSQCMSFLEEIKSQNWHGLNPQPPGNTHVHHPTGPWCPANVQQNLQDEIFCKMF